MASRKEWLPKDGPFIILKQLPPGNPSVLVPDNKKCSTPEEMTAAVDRLQPRMSSEQQMWWRRFILKEKEKREVWDEVTDDVNEAGTSFEPTTEVDEDEDYLRREKELLQLLQKKNYFPKVQIVKVAKGDYEVEKKGTSKRKQLSQMIGNTKKKVKKQKKCGKVQKN